MIRAVVNTLLPGRSYRLLEASHTYTENGREIEVQDGTEWIEIGECGVISPALLKRCGLDPAKAGGLAMGLGLDRILMLRKQIPDIRLLRVDDPRVVSQMHDLSPYRTVSNQPAVKRDLSICVDSDTTPEDIGDQVRSALGDLAMGLEMIEIVSETQYENLPESAKQRMGAFSSQKNLLIRLIVRHPTKTMTSHEANDIRNRVYAAVHKGSKMELIE